MNWEAGKRKEGREGRMKAGPEKQLLTGLNEGQVRDTN
jgi:hypothetical protein